MILEIEWQIALYMDALDIPISLPHLLENPNFVGQTFIRDFGFPGTKHYIQMIEIRRQFKDQIIQFEVLQKIAQAMEDELIPYFSEWSKIVDPTNTFFKFSDLELFNIFASESFIKETIYFKGDVKFTHKYDMMYINILLNKVDDWIYKFEAITHRPGTNGIAALVKAKRGDLVAQFGDNFYDNYENGGRTYYTYLGLPFSKEFVDELSSYHINGDSYYYLDTCRDEFISYSESFIQNDFSLCRKNDTRVTTGECDVSYISRN